MRIRQKLLGCPVDNLSLQETLDLVEQFIKSGHPHRHIVINADKINRYYADPRMREIISTSDIINVDGQPLVWLSYLFPPPLKERIAGIDLMIALLKLAQIRGYKVFLLGAAKEVVTTLYNKLLTDYPGLQIVGYRDGYFTAEEEREVVEEIKKGKPDILFIGISSPRKEMFEYAYTKELAVPFIMGVGGSFDVLAGKRKRAPQILQKAGLEWLFRFLQEPRRLWRRYIIGNFLFFIRVLKELFKTYFLPNFLYLVIGFFLGLYMYKHCQFKSALALLVTVLYVLVTIKNLGAGILILLFSILFPFTWFTSFGVIEGYKLFIDIVAIVLVFSLIRERKLPIPFLPLFIMLLLLIGWLGCSSYWAASSLYAWREMVKWIQYIIIFYLFFAYTVVDGRIHTYDVKEDIKLESATTTLDSLKIINNYKKNWTIFIFFTCILALYGIFKYLITTGGEDFERGVVYSYGYFHRAVATFNGPNSFSGMLNLVLPYALFNGFIIPVMIIGVALLFTYSRGGWLGSLVIIILWSIYKLKEIKKNLLVLLFVFVILVLLYKVLPPKFQDRVFSLPEVAMGKTPESRFDIWKGCLRMIKREPWLGIGAGSFDIVYPEFSLPNFAYSHKLGHANCLYLQFLVEGGIIGEVVFLFWIFTLFWLGIRIKLKKDRWIYWAMLGAFLTHGLVDFLLLDVQFGLVFFALLGVFTAQEKI